MGRAQPRPRRHPLPRAAVAPGRHSGPRPDRLATAGGKRSDLVARPARVRRADAGSEPQIRDPRRRGRRTARGPADRPAQQRMPRRRTPAPAAPGPTRPRSGTPGRSARAIRRGVPIDPRCVGEHVHRRAGPRPQPPACTAAVPALTGRPRPARGGWGPGRRPRAAGPGRDAGRPATNSSTRDPARSAISSRPPPASARLLPNACRSWCGAHVRSIPARREHAAISSLIASGRIGAPIGSRNRLTSTKSDSPARGTASRSNS